MMTARPAATDTREDRAAPFKDFFRGLGKVYACDIDFIQTRYDRHGTQQPVAIYELTRIDEHHDLDRSLRDIETRLTDPHRSQGGLLRLAARAIDVPLCIVAFNTDATEFWVSRGNRHSNVLSEWCQLDRAGMEAMVREMADV